MTAARGERRARNSAGGATHAARVADEVHVDPPPQAYTRVGHDPEYTTPVWTGQPPSPRGRTVTRRATPAGKTTPPAARWRARPASRPAACPSRWPGRHRRRARGLAALRAAGRRCRRPSPGARPSGARLSSGRRHPSCPFSSSRCAVSHRCRSGALRARRAPYAAATVVDLAGPPITAVFGASAGRAGAGRPSMRMRLPRPKRPLGPCAGPGRSAVPARWSRSGHATRPGRMPPRPQRLPGRAPAPADALDSAATCRRVAAHRPPPVFTASVIGRDAADRRARSPSAACTMPPTTAVVAVRPTSAGPSSPRRRSPPSSPRRRSPPPSPRGRSHRPRYAADHRRSRRAADQHRFATPPTTVVSAAALGGAGPYAPVPAVAAAPAAAFVVPPPTAASAAVYRSAGRTPFRAVTRWPSGRTSRTVCAAAPG